jgi:hypothetical protein
MSGPFSQTLPALFVPRATSALPGALGFGNAMLAAFTIVQFADGYLTHMGVSRFGHGIEANPILVWYIAAFGAGTALVGAKSLAVVCGVVLYLNARHLAVGMLTLTYLVAAIWPWTRILWP